MRRALVLTNEAARHPFRQTLNRPVATRATLYANIERKQTDLAFFGTSFVACFIIIMGMII
jgi:hypothetical protein